MAGLWIDSAPPAKRLRQRIVSFGMVAITLAYLFVELAFNFTLVHTLGSPDRAADGITPTAVAGMTEMGLRLTATAVTLLFLGWLAGNYANEQRPFSLGLFARESAPQPWGWRTFVVSAGLLVLIWLMTHKVEDKAFELQEWLATAQERQDLHIGLNATKLGLILANEAARPGSAVKPVTLDVADACLAVTRRRPSSIVLDEKFLAQPGARPLIAAMPHLLAVRWRADGIPFEKKRCEIIQRWKGQLPDATESYLRYVAPAMHSLEDVYDAHATHAVPGAGLPKVDLHARLPLSMLSAGGGITQEALDGCVGGRSHVDFQIVLCLWHAAHEEAARRGIAAGIDYRNGYLQRRQAAVDSYQQVIANKEQAAQTLPDDFSPMSDTERAQVLSAVNGKVKSSQCLIDLQIAEESTLTSLDGINDCEALAVKIRSLSSAAGERRCGLLNGSRNNYSCALYTWGNQWTQEALDFWERHKKDDCVNGSSGIVAQCRAAILGAVAESAEKGRTKLAKFTLDPKRGMLESLSKGRDDHIAGDPALWPVEIQAQLRTAANAMITGATDRTIAKQLALTDADTLPICGTTQDWANALTDARLSEEPRRSELTTVIAGLPWCKAYGRVVRAAGALAFEHQEALPAIRTDIRRQIAAALHDNVVAGQGPDSMAYAWIPDDWMPETVCQFSSRIERAIIRDIVRPTFAEKLSGFRMLTHDEALAVLDAEPKDLRALLALPMMDKKAHEELSTVLNGIFAYAGLTPSQVRDVGLHHSLTVSWQDAWRSDIYRPLVQSFEKSVLRTRLLGEAVEYERKGNDLGSYIRYLAGEKKADQPARCYFAGYSAYYAARLPTLGLGLSVAGLLLHSAKVAYYVLKLLSLGVILRWFGMLMAPLALVLAPILRPTPIVGSPLAQELFRQADWLLPWIVSAQTSYQPLSRLPYSYFADSQGRWDLSKLADPARVEKTTAIEANEQDPRIVKFKGRWPELAAEQSANPDLRKVREMLGSQFLCRNGNVDASHTGPQT